MALEFQWKSQVLFQFMDKIRRLEKGEVRRHKACVNLIFPSQNPWEHTKETSIMEANLHLLMENAEFPVEGKKKHLQTQILSITDICMIYGIGFITGYKVPVL